MIRRIVNVFFRREQSGLLLIIFLGGLMLTILAGSHTDRATGQSVNNFFNSYTLMQTATDACFFAIMAIGITMVIISGGIDLSVGSIYALSGVTMALFLRAHGGMVDWQTVMTGATVSLGVGVACGLLNGVLIVGLRVHPFIITLGAMWVLRGIAFVGSRAESIPVPVALTGAMKNPIGFGDSIYPVPVLLMLAVTILGEIYLIKTVMGRNIYAVGGNSEAARFCGLRIDRTLVGVYAISGLTAGMAAFIGSSFYGSASCADATGYELYVIASAVVGGASLSGGKGSAISAMLGAVLIILIRQSIRTLHFDQNYEWIIIGRAIIVAVVLDRINAGMAVKRLAAEAAAGKTSKDVVQSRK